MPEVFPIVLNSNNADANDTSSYTYKFPRGSVNFKNASIGLSQVNLFYSWRNIDKANFNNSEFDIIFPDGTAPGFTQYNITIPDGNYTIEDLNFYIQKWSIDNNKYLINNTTNRNVYYLELLANPTTYKIQLITYNIPTSLPSGFSQPTNATFSFPTQANQQPSLAVLSNNNFGKLIGFPHGIYFSAVSSETPQMSPISSVLVRCSLLNNKFSNPNDVIFSFVSGTTEYGHMLSVQNQDIVYSNIPDGLYTHLTIKFVDNQFKRLNIIDTNLIIYLIVKID
jgi:hypothetical protein